MTIELWMLFLSVGLGVVHIGAQSMVLKQQVGNAWTVGARDTAVQPPAPVAGRLDRALRNFTESFPLFLSVVWLAHTLHEFDDFTAVGAVMYFAGRLLYLPAYASGLPWVRTILWQIATLGLVLVGVGVLV